MNILGISAGFHDAAASVINRNGDILFAGHSERYSKIKNDFNLSDGLIEEVSQFDIDTIAYYEIPWKKQLRRFYSGEGIEWSKLTTQKILTAQFGTAKSFGRRATKSFGHHLTHAAAGFQTSPFDRATVVVIDAIGEWDTITIWGAEYNKKGTATYKKLWSQHYPHSIGLFYSAITKRVGLKPMDEEYILMGMAAYGKKNWLLDNRLKSRVISYEYDCSFKNNLHAGVGTEFFTDQSDVDLATATQTLTEELIYHVMRRARDFNWSTNLVYMGGVALNCMANRNLGEYFDTCWIMPNPGDSGSSLGAAALAYGRQIKFDSPYLGREIVGPYPVNRALDVLLESRIVGVASGKAEFGPRALGNRSLLADPRGHDIKDKVNEIKRRQKFRPFAPVILEEQVEDYFEVPDGWTNLRYMQVICNARLHTVENFPAIVHADGTARVQTVPKDCKSGIRELLEKWFVMTGCPMLLNTSLNIRGEPIVNDATDANRFEQKYNIKVMT